MDSITQIALGVAVAHVTLPKSLGKHRLWLGAVLGTIPDLDVYIAPILYSNDSLAEVQFHRGFSHSIILFVVISVVFSFLSKQLFKKSNVSLKKWFLSFFLILFTHSLLDVFTTWGTQLLWPLAYKFQLNSIFVVDPLYTLPLLAGVFFYYKKQSIQYINFGLLLSSVYLIIGLGIQAYIKSIITTHLINKDIIAKNITIKPTAFNNVLWNVIVETESDYLLNQYSVYDEYVEEFQSFKKNEIFLDVVPIQLQNQLKEITQNQYTVQKTGDSLIVNDLRFGLLKNTEQEKQFAFSYILFKTNEKWTVQEQAKSKKDGKEMLLKLIERIKGN